MAPLRERKDLVGFIVEVEKDKELAKQFFAIKKSAQKLQTFFEDQGFTKIDGDECKYIMKSKTKKASKELSPAQRREGEYSPCPPNAHY
jgi:DNA-binding protein H-NS